MWGRRRKDQETEQTDSPPQSLGELIRQLIKDVETLIRNEVRMVQTEVGENVRRAVPPLTLMLVGVVLIIGGVFTLLGALVAWLTLLVGAGFAALIVALGAGAAGWALILRGREQISDLELLPTRVAKIISDDPDFTEGQDR